MRQHEFWKGITRAVHEVGQPEERSARGLPIEIIDKPESLSERSNWEKAGNQATTSNEKAYPHSKKSEVTEPEVIAFCPAILLNIDKDIHYWPEHQEDAT